MKRFHKFTEKTLALMLAALIFTLPLTSIAAADGKHNPPPPPPPGHSDRRDDRHDRPNPPPPPPRHDRDHDKDDNGNAVTGFIIGAAVGAIVAKNT